jgi:hypothetical protein
MTRNEADASRHLLDLIPPDLRPTLVVWLSDSERASLVSVCDSAQGRRMLAAFFLQEHGEQPSARCLAWKSGLPTRHTMRIDSVLPAFADPWPLEPVADDAAHWRAREHFRRAREAAGRVAVSWHHACQCEEWPDETINRCDLDARRVFNEGVMAAGLLVGYEAATLTDLLGQDEEQHTRLARDAMTGSPDNFLQDLEIFLNDVERLLHEAT